MDQLLAVREEIYDHFQASPACDLYFIQNEANQDTYAAYYTSMYLLQDTGEALMTHRAKGFSTEPMQGYIEFWGVMQAMFIQQDALGELYKVVMDQERDASVLAAWQELRTLRNVCAGHPANRGKQPQRTFMGRSFGDYLRIQYESWDSATRQLSHPVVDLGALFDQYAQEATNILISILAEMRRKWP
jgi:hypothetical protein